MSNQDPNRKRKENRPTDPFGGPAKRGNTVSFTVALVALAFFLVLQWTNGNMGSVLQSPAASPPEATVIVAAPTPSPQPSPTVDASTEQETPVAQATATIRPTQPPTVTSTAQARGVQTPRATTQPAPTANAPPVARASDLPTIPYDDLPPEAQQAITLIDEGGPFPFSRDGITFQNRERILPRQPEGYYREYTVITPGASNRGARRIVTGEEGEMYYTDDHYESFREIIRQ